MVLEGLKDRKASMAFFCCLFFKALNINWKFGINLANFLLFCFSNNALSLVTYFEQISKDQEFCNICRIMKETNHQIWPIQILTNSLQRSKIGLYCFFILIFEKDKFQIFLQPSLVDFFGQPYWVGFLPFQKSKFWNIRRLNW